MRFIAMTRDNRRTRRTSLRKGLALLAFALCGVFLLAGVRPAAAIETAARQAILIDATTGAVLFEKNGYEPMAPASMSKMMTVHMLFERLKAGSLSLDDTLPVSENAWRKGGAKSGSSTMFLEPGERVRIEDLLRGIVVQSGNDACIVAAEGLAGSEEAFAAEMTRRAHEMGLENSTFKNATGWPNPEHLTTAADLALLAKLAIDHFPEYYHYYSEREFTYNGIRQGNRNPLLYRDMGADGLKTGHTEASGYGLTASAVRGDRRLILVVNGLSSVKERSREAERLLEWAFREFDNYALFDAGETVAKAEVWLGEEGEVPLLIKDPLTISMRRTSRPKMQVAVHYEGPLPAPIAAGETVARLVITAPDFETREIPLYAGAEIERLGLVGRLGAALKYLVWGDAG